jgi:hypothetical protein
VPKCEIFDGSDFHYFYTIKSLWEGDFGVKIKNMLKIFRGSFGAAKFLTRMLSLILRRDFFSLGQHFFFFSGSFCNHLLVPMEIFKIFAVLGTLKIIEHFEFLTRMLRPFCAA